MIIKKYHIGLTQWGFKEWKGNFFTDDAAPDQFLNQYASVFNAVEGNTTFYRAPTPETVERWGEQVPPHFKFCFKFPQSITHYKRLKNVTEEVISFLDLFQPIRSKLGPFHIQLSSQFSYNEIDKLEELIEALPGHLSFAVEVRHEDFYDKGRKERHLDDLLSSYGINRVVFDTRRLHGLKSEDPSVVKARQRKPKLPVRFDSTGANPFIRYVGGNEVIQNESYLKEWAIIIANWIRDGKHPYIFIHSPDTLHAPGLARFFHRELSNLVELNPLPEWPVDRKDKQLGLF
jgi:uncharacterized protein YecE (DUF72 family)